MPLMRVPGDERTNSASWNAERCEKRPAYMLDAAPPPYPRIASSSCVATPRSEPGVVLLQAKVQGLEAKVEELQQELQVTPSAARRDPARLLCGPEASTLL